MRSLALLVLIAAGCGGSTQSEPLRDAGPSTSTSAIVDAGSDAACTPTPPSDTTDSCAVCVDGQLVDVCRNDEY